MSRPSRPPFCVIVDTWADVLSPANDTPEPQGSLADPASAPRVLVVGAVIADALSVARSFAREGARPWTTTQTGELALLLAGTEWHSIMVDHALEAMVRGHLRALGRDTPVAVFATRPLDDWSTHVLPLEADDVCALLARRAA